MVRARRRKPAKLEPEPKPGTETLPPLLPTPLPKPKPKIPGPNNPTIQIMKRVWSKFDVIVVIRGIVDYIAEKGVDPMNNLDNFVEFINKNSSSLSYTGYDCGRITWKLGKNGVDGEKNCTLHLETRNFDDLGKKNDGAFVVGDKDLNLGKNDCGKSVKKGGGVDDGRVLNLGKNDGVNSKKGSVVDNVSNSGKNDGGSSKKGNVVDNVSNSGKNDGGSSKKGNVVDNMSNSGKNDGGSSKKGNVVDNVSNSGKNDGAVSCLSSLNNVKNRSVNENVSNLGKNDGGVYCVSSPSSWGKKSSVVENESNLGKNDGGVSCLSSPSSGRKKSSVVENEPNLGKNDGGVSCVSSPSRGRKKSSVNENELNSRKNDGGVGSSSTSSSGKKSNVCENKSNFRKNDGDVSSLSSQDSVNKCSAGEKKSNLGPNDGGVSCLTNLKNAKKTGGKKGNCKENVGGNKCVSSRKDVEKSKLGVDYGGVYYTEIRKDRRKRRNRGCGSRWTFGGRIRTTKGLVVGKKSILKGKEDGGGNKHNSNKNARRDDSVIQVKKGGLKNNNGGCADLTDFGCWDKNEVILREAVRRMISRRLSLRDELETDLLWCPPRIGVLKWNTDASVREDDNKAAIGGVLRDWNGSFRCVFSCPLDCCESNEAEVKAIYKALEIASCKDWLLNLHMVIESDSMNAVRWCNEENGGPLNLGHMLNFIRECRRWWPGLEIVYMGRKSNSVADRLSKQGHERSADFVAWM